MKINNLKTNNIMKQTAVEWLQEQLKDVKYNPLETNGYSNALERIYDQAKEMEKQQQGYSEEDMLKSFMAGIKCESNSGKNFEQFIQQFKNKNENEFIEKHNNMKQTAAEKLGIAFREWQREWDSFEERGKDKPVSYDEFIKPFLEMEKQQIIDACNQEKCFGSFGFKGYQDITKGEQYYNETFKNK